MPQTRRRVEKAQAGAAGAVEAGEGAAGEEGVGEGAAAEVVSRGQGGERWEARSCEAKLLRQPKRIGRHRCHTGSCI